MARTIAVVCEKGGVGKTTTSINLSAALAELHRRVLVIDIDKQGHSTEGLGLEKEERRLFDILLQRGDLSPLVTKTAFGVDVIPGCEFMATFDVAVATAAATGSVIGAEKLLKKALNTLPLSEYDYVFIDCPPSLGQTSINALTAADMYLIPVFPGEINLSGIVALEETVEQIREELNHNLLCTGILAGRVEKRTLSSRSTTRALKEHFGQGLYDTVIHKNVKVEESWNNRQPVTAYDPKSSAAQEFRQLAGEFEARLKSEEGRRVNG